MPEVLETQCPHCQKSMELKSRKALGKQAPCPGCKKPFLVKEKLSEDIEDYDEFGGGYDDEFGGDDFDDYDAPEPRRRSSGSRGGSSKKKKKRKSKPKWMKPTLIIGGSVLGVAFVGLTIWLVWSMFSKELELAYLPPDATNISVERTSAQWSARSSSMSMSGIDSGDFLDKIRDEWGVTPKDIKSVTTAISPESGALKVVRSSAKFDEDKITGHAKDVKTEEYEGESYYLFTGGSALYFPDKYTAISGSEEAVKQAIKRGDKIRDSFAEKLSFVDASHIRTTINIRSSSSSKLPKITVSGSSYGSSSSSSKSQRKYRSESAAKDAFEKAEEELEEMKEKWKESGREKQRERYEKRQSTTTMTDSEIRGELDSHDSSLNSISNSLSGDILTSTSKSYSTAYDKRKAKERAEKAKGEMSDSKIEKFLELSAKSWGMSYFGINARVRLKRPSINRPNISTTRPRITTTRRKRVTKYDFTYQKYTGKNDVSSAIKEALSKVTTIDSSKTVIDLPGKKVTVSSKPDTHFSFVQIMRALEGNGFQSVRPKFAGTSYVEQ
jgi:hypothetical protein